MNKTRVFISYSSKDVDTAEASERSKNCLFGYQRLKSELIARGVKELTDDLQLNIDWWRKDDRGLQEQ